MDDAPNSLPRYNLNLRSSYDRPIGSPLVSIVICTYGRPESLNVCLKSLEAQTFDNFEVILITEKGDLSTLRDIGLRCSYGDIVSFIDDDVYCHPTWLRGVVQAFGGKGDGTVVGVSGPTFIPDDLRNGRDLFKYKWAKRLYDCWFIGKAARIPGAISECGAPSTASNERGCKYEGEVDYLEACNMSVKRREAIDVGGFDSVFTKTGEWCEVDLALRLKRVGRLVFSPEARLEHRPSTSGIFSSRLSTKHRFENFMVFQRRWIKPSLRTYLYRGFVWAYFILKQNRMI